MNTTSRVTAPVAKITAIGCAVIALLLFVAAGWGWHRGWVREHLCKPVLERPIRFEDGFSFASSFSVAYEGYYWIEVVCPRANSSRSQREGVFSALSRQLPVRFTITCDGVTVAEGDSLGENSTSHSAAEDTRIITKFKGEPGKRYTLSFRTLGAIPALDATKPMVRIGCLCWASDNLFDMLFYDTTLAWIIAGVGMLFAVWSCRVLMRKLSQYSIHST
jgi:hypothetical protein